MDSIVRSFLWGGKNNIRWVEWGTVCRPKEFGGMGIKSAEDLNVGLFSKQAAKLLGNGNDEIDNSWWKRLVSSKYGAKNGSWTLSGSSYCWKNIQKVFNGCYLESRWIVGDGNNVEIWDDRWIMEEPLQMYPWTIHVDSFNKERVSKLILPNGNWNFEEAKNRLPEGVVQNLPDILRSDKDHQWSDRIKNGKYNLRDAHNLVIQERIGESGTLWKQPGQFIGSRRVWWFAWKLLRNKLPTRENLKIRNIIQDDSCPMCVGNIETLEHLFLRCPYAVCFWERLELFFNWKLHGTNLDSIMGRIARQRKLDIWMAARQALTAIGLWILWKERNERIFGTLGVHHNDHVCTTRAVLRVSSLFRECWTLPKFSLLSSDLRFDAWMQGIGCNDRYRGNNLVSS